MTRRSLRFAAFACVAGLAGVACGGASGGEDTSSPASAVEAAPETAAPATDPAADGDDVADASVEPAPAVPALLQFTAPLIGGGEIVGDELAGKPTAFWFWSPT